MCERMIRLSETIMANVVASYTAAGDIALVEEADVDAAALRWRRGEARLEPGVIARFQRGLLQHGVPGIDFRALRVADREAQPRQVDGLVGLADDHAFDHQHRLALHSLGRDLDVLEGE